MSEALPSERDECSTVNVTSIDQNRSFEVDDAIAIAVVAHRGQRDKGGSMLPYVTHPIRVMSAFDDPILQMVAVLHDVIEDTSTSERPVTVDFLRAQGVPDRVVKAVDCLTKRDDEEMMDYLSRVRRNPDALAVKFTDIADNADPGRLSLLPANEADRLREKYQKAFHFLREQQN